MEDIDDDHMLLHEQPMQRTASSSADSEGLYLLPNETLEAVLLHLRSDVLATATQVSHRWRAVAERVLYSNISITEVVSIGSPTPIRTVRACQSVQSRRELQPNVKSFHVRWQSRPGDGPPVQVLEGAFQTHVAPCLLRLHNIESLELSLGGLSRQFVESPNWRLFLDRTFPFVQQLSLTGIGNASVALHSDALPALHRFRGGPGTAAAITPHRPVESLVLVGNDSIPWSDLERLGAASSSLKELDLTHMSVTPLLLRNISKYLSTVEILRLKLALRHTLHFAYSGVRLLAGLTPVLSAFTNIILLDLSPTTVDGIGEGSPNEEMLLCVAWGGGCSTLSQVVFPKSRAWMRLLGNQWVVDRHDEHVLESVES